MTFYNEDERPWKDLTDEEKGALLLARHEGKTIQFNPCGIWVNLTWDFDWIAENSYRVKPEPKRETVELYWARNHGATTNRTPLADTHRITFDWIDGKPDCESIRMEEL